MKKRTIKVYLISAFIIFFINQLNYNLCIQPHCIFAALPKVIVYSAIFTFIYCWIFPATEVLNGENGSNEIKNKGNGDD